MSADLHPYVVFLPGEHKTRILGAIFGTKAAVDILKFSLTQGISRKIYQKDLMTRLAYSNKTIIENLKLLTQLGVLSEDMEKVEKHDRAVWVKAYRLSDIGKWFALLLAEERDLSQKEKTDILQKIFKKYIEWVKRLSTDLNMPKEALRKIFDEEMK